MWHLEDLLVHRRGDIKVTYDSARIIKGLCRVGDVNLQQ